MEICSLQGELVKMQAKVQALSNVPLSPSMSQFAVCMCVFLTLGHCVTLYCDRVWNTS